MAEYIYGNPNKAHSWKNVASIFAAHDSLNSAQTSSLPLVQFWCPSGTKFGGNGMRKEALDLLENCFGKSHKEEFKHAKLCFEYSVPVHGKSGRGKASMTDLMILTEKHAIAVEAKWTECKDGYQAICQWFRDKTDKTDNKEDVLQGWIAYINEYFETKEYDYKVVLPTKEDRKDIPYQMVHRIASACDVAKKEGKVAAVIYQLFYSDEALQNSEEGGKSTLTVAEGFAENLQKGYDTLFKDINHPVPIKFCIMMTKVAKGDNYVTAMQKCKKDGDLNELFLEMQKNGGIYKFSSLELFFPNQKKE